MTLIRVAGRLLANLYRATVVAGVNRSRIRRGVGPLDRSGRRQLAGLTVFCLVLAGCMTTANAASPRTTATASVQRPPATPATQPAPQSPAPPTSTTSSTDVGRVIDGDTFELASGATVRVLGIDSCEADTPGGAEATALANRLLTGPVELTAEPGADKDRYGRLLRYVRTSSGDFGELMVKWDHTGVYQGRGDASPTYVAMLYAHDLDQAANPPSGRECGSYPPPVKVDRPNYVPLPDNDDHWRKPKICYRKWWC